MQTDEMADIVKMSRMDCSHLTQVSIHTIRIYICLTKAFMFTQDDLAKDFPALDLFFFLTFDALCTANHFIEGSFSNKGQLLRDNISDERLDRKAKYRQNESHPIIKDVIGACIDVTICVKKLRTPRTHTLLSHTSKSEQSNEK